MTTVLKFYATNPSQPQKLFAFKVSDIEAAKRLLLTFEQNGSKINAVWISKNEGSRCLYNWRMNIGAYKLFRCLIPYLNASNLSKSI